MNISTILIVTIGSILFAAHGNNSLQGNNAQFTFNINAQSPQAEQGIMFSDPLSGGTDGFAWQKIITDQWNKYSTSFFALTAVSAYGYLWYQLYKARAILSNPQAWCCWKNHIEIDRLAQYCQEELSKELLLDIQERYINNANPTDFVIPLASFLPIIEKEKQMLELYIWWSTKMITSYMRLLFPVNKQCVHMACQALQRLKFIKNLFIVWWAQRNTQNSFSKG